MVTILGDLRDQVGESPFWDGNGNIWSVDIVGKRINRRTLKNGATESWTTSDLPTAIALGEDGIALVSFAKGLGFWSANGGECALHTCPETDAKMRLNEGKCDPSGRMWVASMENNLNDDLTLRKQENARGTLFRIDGKQAAPVTAAEFSIPNTMAWSPDRSKFYLGDSVRNTIWVWDYDDRSGSIENRNVFTSGGPGLPDGSCMDSEGFLWNARYAAGRVIRYAPDGTVDREISLPVQNPTATTFAGDDLSVLIVTSACFDMENPGTDDGAMLAVETSTTGQPENWFRPTGSLGDT